MTQVVLFNVFNGLIVGAFYALMALGLSLILNLSGVINFAHGGFLALGAYLAYTLIPYVGFWGALVIAPLLTAALGLVVERLLIRPLYGGDPLYGLLLTFGLAYILEDGTRTIWGAQSLPFQVPAVADDVAVERILLPHRISRVHGRDRRRGGRRGCSRSSTIPGSASASAPARAISTPLRRSASTCAFCAASISASASTSPGLAGVLAAGLLGLSPTIGADLHHAELRRDHRRRAGQSRGTLIGGLLIGVASGVTAVYCPSATEAVIYVMMGLVLLVRPRGLLGEEGRLH